MINFTARAGICLIASMVSLNAFADNNITKNTQTKSVASEQKEEAGRLHVQISNSTNANCQLSNQYLSHGTLASAPPQSLMAGDSKTFDLNQSLMGPDIYLTYTCGENSIRFEVQQDYAYLMGHTPTVTVEEANGLKLTYDVTSSSMFWDSPGIANIVILTN